MCHKERVASGHLHCHVENIWEWLVSAKLEDDSSQLLPTCAKLILGFTLVDLKLKYSLPTFHKMWLGWGGQGICRQSIKKPNLWNSKPVNMRSTLTMVGLCSRDFKLHSDTSSIMPYQLVIELHAFEWMCVKYTQRFFCKLINEGSWGAMRWHQILF